MIILWQHGDAIRTYELSEEQFKRAQTSYRKYEKSGIVDIYNRMCEKKMGRHPEKTVHYVAGTLELTPSEARNDLTIIQVLDGNHTKNDDMERTEKICRVYNISQIVIDNIMRDPKLTPEEKNKKICELELAEYERVSKNVEEANKKQGAHKYKIAREGESREIS